MVGISTKHPAWNWVIRRNTIVGAGTGLYLGNSDGTAEFVGGLIEHNLILDSIGYDAQIKHQSSRATALGISASAETIIRHNVFSKAQGYSTGADARPTLLVGHWPLTGAGSTDRYLIYGNLFYQNPSEALFQGEGNIALYANLFLNRDGPAIHIQPHNDRPRTVEVFWNTVVATTTGVQVTGGEAGYVQRVRLNAVFSGQPLSGGVQSDNVWDLFTAAGGYLVDPGGTANLTVVGPGAAGFVALYVAGQPRPATSTLNFRAGQTRANSAVVALSEEGEVAAFSGSAASAHLVLDVVGYFR